MGNAVQKASQKPQWPRTPEPVNKIDVSFLESDDEDDVVIFDKTNVAYFPHSQSRAEPAVGGTGPHSPHSDVPSFDSTTREKPKHAPAPIIIYPQTDSSEIKDIADNLPHIQSNPLKWELSLRAEIKALSLDSRQSRQLITLCCPNIGAYQISEGAKLCRSDGLPYQCSWPEHEEALSKMIDNAKCLVRASTDSSVLTKTKQKEGENVREFIHKFKLLFDRHIGLDGGHKANQHLFNQLLMDGLHPHLKQAILSHDPILWKYKTLDEMLTLAEHFHTIVAPPIHTAKLFSVITPDGHIRLHPTHHTESNWGSEGSRQQGQRSDQGNAPHTSLIQNPFTQNSQISGLTLRRDYLCFSCGKADHALTNCPRPNVDLPFKPKHWHRRSSWILKHLGKNQ